MERLVAIDEVHREHVEKRLTGIENTLSRLVWLVIGAIVMAIMTYVLQGGLSV